MSSSFRAPPAPSSGEIDLVVLFKVLWKQKRLLLLVTAGGGLIAAAYAFLATPLYSVSSVLRPAALNELDALNRSQVYQLPPSEALIKVGASLESYNTRLAFFRANQKLFKEFEQPGRTLEQSFEEFNRNSINLVLPDSKKTDLLSAYIELNMTYPEGIDGVSIVNGFVDFVINAERERIALDMVVIVNNRQKELKEKLAAARSGYEAEKAAKIASLVEADALRRAQLLDELKALRAQLKTLRTDRVSQLNEAIEIARSLGIRKPTTPSFLADTAREASSNMMRTEINNQPIPLYFMGSETLEAERTALLQRKSDDFSDGRVAQIAKELQLLQSNRQVEVLNSRKNEDLFLSGIESLRAEEVRLSNLNTDLRQMKLVTVDKRALEPLGPVKPQKIRIIITGLLIGMMLGIMLAILRYAASRPPAAWGGSVSSIKNDSHLSVGVADRS